VKPGVDSSTQHQRQRSMSAKVIEEDKSLTKTPDNKMFTPKKNDYVDNIYQPYT
jgi:hypothetical protein